jgi:hypothetical protein
VSELVYLALFLLIGPVLVTITSGLLAFATYLSFGPNLSARPQWMADTFMGFYALGAKMILGGPLRLFRGDNGPTEPPSPPTVPDDHRSIPHEKPKQLPKSES